MLTVTVFLVAAFAGSVVMALGLGRAASDRGVARPPLRAGDVVDLDAVRRRRENGRAVAMRRHPVNGDRP